METNIDATFKTTTQWTIDNGGHSTGEPRPSEPMLEEVMLSLEDLDQDSEEETWLLSDHTEEIKIKRSGGTTPTERMLDSETRFAWMFMVLSIDTTDGSTTGHATWVLTKLGTLIKLDTHTQDNHWLVDKDSKLDQEWLDSEHSSGMSTLEEVNTDSELETTLAETEEHGGLSTRELELSDLITEEHLLSPIEEDMASELMSLLSLDNTEMKFIKDFHTMEVQEETSEMLPVNALMYMEEETLT